MDYIYTDPLVFFHNNGSILPFLLQVSFKFFLPVLSFWAYIINDWKHSGKQLLSMKSIDGRTGVLYGQRPVCHHTCLGSGARGASLLDYVLYTAFMATAPSMISTCSTPHILPPNKNHKSSASTYHGRQYSSLYKNQLHESSLIPEEVIKLR